MNHERRQTDFLLWFVIFTFGMLMLSYQITLEDLWADEAFSAAMTDHSFADILELSSKDFHTPLYYLALKTFRFFSGDSVLSLRLFSVFGSVMLAALGLLAVPKVFDKKTGALFAVIVFLTPATIQYSHEVRMYTWASFLSLGTLLYLFIAIKSPRPANLAVYGLFLLATMCIHVYGLVGAFVFHVPVLIYLLLKKRELVPRMLLVWIPAVLAYLPWLMNLFSMTPKVSGIPDMSLARFLATLVHPFDYREWSTFRFWETGVAWPTYVVVLALTLIGFACHFIAGKRREFNWQMALVFASYYLTLLFFVLASILFRPIVEPRYMLVMIGFMLLPLAWGVLQIGRALPHFSRNKAWKVTGVTTGDTRVRSIVVLLFLVWYATANSTVIADVWTHRYNGGMREVVARITPQLKEDDVFIHTHELTLGTFSYYFPEHEQDVYFPTGSTGNWPLDVFRYRGRWSDRLEELTAGVKSGWIVSYTYNFNAAAHEALMAHFSGYLGETKVVELPYSWYKVTFVRFDMTAH